jgi:hypothetical protein
VLRGVTLTQRLPLIFIAWDFIVEMFKGLRRHGSVFVMGDPNHKAHYGNLGFDVRFGMRLDGCVSRNAVAFFQQFAHFASWATLRLLELV